MSERLILLLLSILPKGRHTQKAEPVQGASHSVYLMVSNFVFHLYGYAEQLILFCKIHVT